MAKAYTVQLAHLVRSGTFDVVVAVCNPNETIVVRDVALTTSDRAAAVQAYITTPGTSVLVPVFWSAQRESDFIHLELRQALVEGQELHVASLAATTQIAITGYQLSAF